MTQQPGRRERREIDQMIAAAEHYAFHAPGQYAPATRKGCPLCEGER